MGTAAEEEEGDGEKRPRGRRLATVEGAAGSGLWGPRRRRE